MVERDPEVQRLAVETLRLVIKAEMVYEDLVKHSEDMAAFLERASRYTDQGGSDGRDPG